MCSLLGSGIHCPNGTKPLFNADTSLFLGLSSMDDVTNVPLSEPETWPHVFGEGCRGCGYVDQGLDSGMKGLHDVEWSQSQK